MKRALAIALVFFCIYGAGRSQAKDPVIVRADFDRGSIGKLTEIKPGYLKGTTRHWIKNDSVGNQYYWFCFSLENVKDREITVELNELSGVYRGKPVDSYTPYTHPVYSYDKVNWGRIDNVEYIPDEKTFIFKKAFSKDVVYVAYAHPYSYFRLNDLVALIEEDDNVQVDYFGRTSKGNYLPKISITNAESKKEKKLVYVQAMQHSGEDAGGYMVEGLINYLRSADSLANEILNSIEFVIVPMLNPDGFYIGTSRYTSLMGDLNSQWAIDDPKTIVEPEVMSAQVLIDKLHKKRGIDLFVDIHCHGQEPGKNTIISRDPQNEQIATLINQFWKIKYTETTVYNNSAGAYMTKKYSIPAFTLELSQSYADKTKKYLTIYDYMRYGEGLAKAAYLYLMESD